MRIERPIFRTLAAVLVAAGAVVFAVYNLQDRLNPPQIPDDGVVWVSTDLGVSAQDVRPGSPAANTDIRRGDVLRAIYWDGAFEEIRVPEDVRVYLDEIWKLPPSNRNLLYAVERYNSRGISTGIWEGDVRNVEKRPNDTGRELWYAVVGVVFLAIGLFGLVRQGRAPYTTHFYWICLTAFLVFALKSVFVQTEDGTWAVFDRAVFLTKNIALLLLAPLFLHFCAVFPKRRGWLDRHKYGAALIYLPAAVLIALEVAMMIAPGGFSGLVDWRNALNTLTIAQFSAGFVGGAALLVRAFRRESVPILRQQLKWIVWGVGLGTFPFAIGYTWPYLAGRDFVPPFVQFVTLGPLILVPLSFGYAIVRYRLMDVDVIVRRSFVQLGTTATVGACYMLLLLAVDDAVKSASLPISPAVARGVTVALMLLLTVLFGPVKRFLQETADKFFYGERYSLRRGLGEFGRALASTSALEPLLDSLAARLKRMLSVEQLAIFVEDGSSPDGYRLALATGIEGPVALPADFRRWVRANSTIHGYAVAADEAASWHGIYYLVPCVVRDRLVAVIGIGQQASDGSMLTSEDIEILRALSGYVAVAIDNSLLLRSEQEKARLLAHLKQFSESIVESVNVGILVIDRDGRITTWNSALEKMLGITRDEALGANALRIFNEEMVRTIRDVTGVEGWVAEEVRHLYKFRTLTRDDRSIVINLSLAPFEDAARTLAGTLVVVEDVTDSLKLEEQVQQFDKLNSIGLLAAGVAHEVNTPLAGISSYAQMLISQIPDEDPKNRVLQKILVQTQRASGIVNNLLNFSRTSGSDFAPLDLNRVLEDTLQLLEIQLRKSDITVERGFAADLPEAIGNAGKLQQVFMNLILNARDAMPEGGQLAIETESVDHMLVVRVSDTGIGIAPANISKIYDPFFTTKAVGQGTGLGLALSYGIVQEHSGRIVAESQPGRGTTFTIKIPSRYRRLQAASD
jgi:two-component system, NtrC family, sensor kinase